LDPSTPLHDIMRFNTEQLSSQTHGNDNNVKRVWLQGVTGCGVTVGIVDDGKVDDCMQYSYTSINGSNFLSPLNQIVIVLCRLVVGLQCM
jgi:hypothetical protein